MSRSKKNVNNKLFQVVIKRSPDTDGPDVSIWTIASDIDEACDIVRKKYKNCFIYNINCIAWTSNPDESSEVLLI